MDLSEETLIYLTRLSNLLNGQIRGVINKKASEENLELIQMTLSDVYENSFTDGYKMGVNDTVTEEIQKQLINDIKDSLTEEAKREI